MFEFKFIGLLFDYTTINNYNKLCINLFLINTNTNKKFKYS